MDSERDFYSEDNQQPPICCGFCIYCKEEVIEGDDVFFKGFIYHKDCFILENTNVEPGVWDE